jgi:hypothetical protein
MRAAERARAGPDRVLLGLFREPEHHLQISAVTSAFAFHVHNVLASPDRIVPFTQYHRENNEFD